MDLKELEREHTRFLKRHRNIRYASWQRLVKECMDEYAMVEWAQTPEVRQLAPDTLPQKERPPYWGIISFARSAMP
jgi:hypothetical protein